MKRRDALSALAASALCTVRVLPALAQASRPPLIGWLGYASGEHSPLKAEFHKGMRERGLRADREYIVTERFARNHTDLDVMATEIVVERPTVIVAGSTAGVAAARRATKDIPIVGCALTDPVALGFIKSHARPGTNVTGVLSTTEELAGKQLSLAVELLGGAPVIGLLSNPANPGSASQVSGATAAAAALRLLITKAEAGSPEVFDAAFDALRHAGARIVNVIGDATFVNESSALAASALKARLPTMYNAREHVRAGGLMSYGISLAANFRHAAVFVDRIIRGETPANLPVELPPTYELAVNLITARLLALDVPVPILTRADEVIE
jgi:putative ABC transport system substrate-binding protein